MSTERELSDLFRAERAVRPTATGIEHGLQRLIRDLAANAAPAPIATGALKLGSSLIPKWLLAGFVVGMAGFGAGASMLEPKPVAAPSSACSALVVQRRAPPIAVVREGAPLLPDAPSSQSLQPSSHVATVASAASVASVASAPSAPTAANPVTFDAELKLITLAKGELDARRFFQTRAWLAEHAQRFPNGVFAVEREALGALTDCEQGPKNEALARAFATRHPGSPLVGRLERACRATVDFSKSLNEVAPAAEPTAGPEK